MAATLVVALAGSACSGGDSDLARQIDAAQTSAPALQTTSTTSAPALAGDDLVVVDQGVTAFPDPFDRSATLGGYGVILHNPNEDVMAVGVRVVTRILDASGAELLVDSTLLNAVMPSQRMALGRGLIEPIEDPTQLEITVEVSAWVLPKSKDGSLIATDVVTEPEPNGGAITRFNVHSTWPSQEEGVDVTAIYRAADGRLVGAESTTLATVAPDSVTPGQIRLLTPLPDVATTEVFVGRGLAAQTTG